MATLANQCRRLRLHKLGRKQTDNYSFRGGPERSRVCQSHSNASCYQILCFVRTSSLRRDLRCDTGIRQTTEQPPTELKIVALSTKYQALVLQVLNPERSPFRQSMRLLHSCRQRQSEQRNNF